jgi:hypothetical protein
MPAVRYVRRLRGTLATAGGILLTPIARDDLGSRISGKPAGERLRLSIRQELYEPVLF